MIQFTAFILKFDKQGEKTGWTYIEIPAEAAGRLKPGNKKSFRVKGKLDQCVIKQTALLPMGNGDFILPLNAAIRKKLGKRKGEKIKVQMEADEKPVLISRMLMSCLADEPEALNYFNGLPKSHQNYYSNWIESAKTEPTKAKRIAHAINAFVRKQSFSEMMRAMKNDRNLLLS
ncbi:MAG: YdeI/OmpD-associated family protein [Chitinophagales bacterium]